MSQNLITLMDHFGSRTERTFGLSPSEISEGLKEGILVHPELLGQFVQTYQDWLSVTRPDIPSQHTRTMAISDIAGWALLADYDIHELRTLFPRETTRDIWKNPSVYKTAMTAFAEYVGSPEQTVATIELSFSIVGELEENRRFRLHS